MTHWQQNLHPQHFLTSSVSKPAFVVLEEVRSPAASDIPPNNVKLFSAAMCACVSNMQLN
jgi:hypothetical protein